MNALPINRLEPVLLKSRTLKLLGIAAVFLGGTFWLYAPATNYEFVNWDDPWYIQNNPLIQSWSVSNLKGIATETVTRNYAPLTIFSFLLDYTFYGDWAGGFHITNILLHAVNGLLVFFLIQQITTRTGVAIATAILFIAHPVQVESVAWISSRKGLLSGTFILASLLFWLRTERTLQDEARGIGFLALALLCKAIAVIVPALVIGYDVLVRRKKFSDALVKQMIPGFLALWLLFTTMASQVTQIGGLREHLGLNKFEILAIDVTILWRYIGKLFFPFNLCVLYDIPVTGFWPFAILSGFAWGMVGRWLWSKRNTNPLIVFAALSWIFCLLPVLNFFPITTLINDRYLYLPSIPAFAILAGCGGVIIERFKKLLSQPLAMGIATVAFAGFTLGLVYGTRTYLPVWKTDVALWEHAVQHAPNLTTVQIQRAISLNNKGETDAALLALDYALTNCQPDKIDRKRIREMKATYQSP